MPSVTLSRRGFFKALGGAAIGFTAGAELLELLAPTRTIFLPPAGGWITHPSWNGGAISLAELQAITRKAFVPKLITQIYASSPLFEQMLQNAQGRQLRLL
jgi:hypothetical protein